MSSLGPMTRKEEPENYVSLLESWMDGWMRQEAIWPHIWPHICRRSNYLKSTDSTNERRDERCIPRRRIGAWGRLLHSVKFREWGNSRKTSAAHDYRAGFGVHISKHCSQCFFCLLFLSPFLFLSTFFFTSASYLLFSFYLYVFFFPMMRQKKILKIPLFLLLSDADEFLVNLLLIPSDASWEYSFLLELKESNYSWYQ